MATDGACASQARQLALTAPSLPRIMIIAGGYSSAVERQLPKLNVTGSNPVTRSNAAHPTCVGCVFSLAWRASQMTDNPIVTIYTDGGCRPNPGPGGWGAILIYGDHERELSGSEADTTNNRMELTAAIKALRVLKTPCVVHLHTDSEYLKLGITEWLPNWLRRGWRRGKGGQGVKNRDLWEELAALAEQHDIHWHWVRGHAGDVYNERVDRLANRAIPD